MLQAVIQVYTNSSLTSSRFNDGTYAVLTLDIPKRASIWEGVFNAPVENADVHHRSQHGRNRAVPQLTIAVVGNGHEIPRLEMNLKRVQDITLTYER